MKLTGPLISLRSPLRLLPVAFDSFGVMAMCTQVTTPDITVTIDPAASMEPDSFPLPRDRREQLLEHHREAVARSCSASGAIVISHYHLDHFTLERNPQLYSGKVLFIKSPEDLPGRQRGLARRFLQTIDGLPREIIIADGRRFRFGKTEIGFSNPVWHGGIEASPGKVLMTEIQRGRSKVLIASDVAGPVARETAELIAALAAREIVLDGYPTYAIGQFANETELACTIINICRILAAPGLKTLILDHHSARDPHYPDWFRLCYERAAALGVRFGTAAELSGQTSAVLLSGAGQTRRRSAPRARFDPDLCRRLIQDAVAARTLTPDWLADLKLLPG